MNGYHQDLSTNIENSRNSLRRIARNDDHEFSRESIINLMEKFVKSVNIMDDTILVPCRLMDRAVGDSMDTVVIQKNFHCSNKKKTVHDNLNSAELFNLYNMLNGVKVDLLWGRNCDEQPEELQKSSSKQQLIQQQQQQQQEQPKSQDQLKQAQEQQPKHQQQQSQLPSSQITASPLTTPPPIILTQQSSSPSLQTPPSSLSSPAQHQFQQPQFPVLQPQQPTTTPIEQLILDNTTNSKDIKGHIRRPSTASVASSNSTNTLSDSESEISNENDSGIETEPSSSDKDKSTELAKQYRIHLLGLYRCLEQMTEAANYLTARYQSDIGPLI